MKQGRCFSCGAALLWAMTGAGKKMPVDAEPCAEGNVTLDDRDGVLIARVRTAEALAGLNGSVKRYRSHFASCKTAHLHRKPKAAAPAADSQGGQHEEPGA